MKIIDRKVTSQKSFYRTEDKSWASISTSWVKNADGTRTGIVYSSKCSDEAAPVLAKLLQEEMKKRKYDHIEASGLSDQNDAKKIVELMN